VALKTVAVFRKQTSAQAEAVLRDLADWAAARDVRLVDEAELAQRVARGGAGVDLVVVLGGDGTLLAAVRALEGREVPVLGVNLGYLGFLTELTLDDLYPALDRIAEHGPDLDPRATLEGEVERAGRVLRRFRVLNDAVVNRGALARICSLEVRVDGAYLTHYRGDGLIVSTPTGSTAYNLAAGGPIVTPDVPAIVLAPICPHTLTHRPILLADRRRVEIRLVAKNGEVYLTLDGQEGMELEEGDRIRVGKGRSRVLLVRAPRRDYYQVVRTKLMWGDCRPGGGQG